MSSRVSLLRAAVLSCTFGMLSPLMHGQQHVFTQFTPKDGLAQSQVRSMAQDEQGYLWFGTLGGASRFDGLHFTNHALQEGLPDAQISAMVQEPSGRLWLGSGSHLVWRHGRSWVREALPGTSARIMGLAAAPDGRIYAGTDGGGLHVRDVNGIRLVPGYPLDTAANVRTLLMLRDGRLLIGLRNGLLLYDGHDFSPVPLPGDMPMAISALAEAADGAWWVGTFLDGLFHVGRKGVRHYDEESGLIRNNVRCLTVDDRDRLWVGTKFGLNMIEEGRIRTFTVHQGMPNDNIWCSFQDSEGNMWFGTDGAGALKFAGDRFVTFTVRDGLCSDLVMTVIPDAQGDLWLGTYDNGLCRMDAMAMVNTLDGLPNNTIWCGLTDRRGLIWLGTSDGVAYLERGRVGNLPREVSLPGQRVLSMHADEKGHIWCGTRDGLTAITPTAIVHEYPSGPGGPGRSIRNILSVKGQLWLATEQGISIWDGRSFRTLTTSDGLSDNTVFSLLKDEQGRIWAGTANGLTCITGEQERILRFTADFGSNYVDALVADEQGRIWAGTNNGLFIFHPDSLLQDSTAFRHITMNDGLRSMEFNLNAGFRDQRGRIFFGSTAGLVFHDVRRHPDHPSPTPPRVHITGLRSFLQVTDWSQQSDSLSPAGLPIGLELSHRRNYLTFDYNGISLSEPGKVRYRYRLLGLDNDWLSATDARFASYSSLPHGEFTFEVMTTIDGVNWNGPARFSFRIAPPFWLRSWFFVLVLLALGGLAYGVQRYRARVRERRERTRQLMLRSRMLQLEQQALNANMNRHFVFNALNSIQYHINKQDRATASRYLTSFAKLIRRNLDASQSDTTSLREELERLELYLILEGMRFKDRFQYAITLDPRVDVSQVRLPAMMLQPYVENSIWHGILPSERPGRVDIRVQPAGKGRVSVLIEDDGIGVDQSRRNKQDSDSDHISRGIEITKGRADVLRKLDLTDIRISGPDQWHDPETGAVLGTRVAIELPESTVAQKTT
jgi:ligand-binding sensor domain-containing protein/two-component sensor histidine kinase